GVFAVLAGRRFGALKLRPHKEIFTMTALMRRTVIIRIVRKYVTIDVPFPLLSGVSPSLVPILYQSCDLHLHRRILWTRIKFGVQFNLLRCERLRCVGPSYVCGGANE